MQKHRRHVDDLEPIENPYDYLSGVNNCEMNRILERSPCIYLYVFFLHSRGVKNFVHLFCACKEEISFCPFSCFC